MVLLYKSDFCWPEWCVKVDNIFSEGNWDWDDREKEGWAVVFASRGVVGRVVGCRHVFGDETDPNCF
jgi:hypothetical protein